MKRICGIEMQESGDIAAVWIAFNPETDLTQVYDCFKFQKNEVMAVVASALRARGLRIPVAWKNPEFAEALKKEGCLMIPYPATETDEMADMVSREIFERMRTGRFKVDSRLGEWKEEMQMFSREDNKIPKNSFPLMAATRHAIAMLKFARGEGQKSKPAYPKLAVH